MPLPTLIRFDVMLAALLLATAPVVASQVYKWVDGKGVVNYGNKPPAASRGAKAPTLVEDRVSVYTPDPALTQATQNARNRSGLPNSGRGYSAQQPDPRAIPPAAAAQTPPVPYSDACAEDVNCYGYPAVYPRRHIAPRLVQPQLPPGAIAGNVNQGNGYIPGLSTQAQPASPPTIPGPPMRGRVARDPDDRGSYGGHRSR